MIQCRPNIFVLFKNPTISIIHTDNVFLVSKTWFLRNTPRFRQVLILEFWYNVGPISLHSSKSPRFWQAKVGHGLFCVKKMVLKKYPKILTCANPKISIRCKPNISVLFKSPKILTSKSRTWFFGVKKWFLWNSPKILTGAKPKISIRCKPNIFVPFKSPKILTSKIGHGYFCLFVFLCVSKTWFLWNTPRFWQVFYLTFWKIVGPKSLFSLKIPRFWQAK